MKMLDFIFKALIAGCSLGRLMQVIALSVIALGALGTLVVPQSAAHAQAIETLHPSPAAPTKDSLPLDPALVEPQQLVQHGKAFDAEPLIRSFLTQYPNSAAGHFLLGLALFREMQEGVAVSPSSSTNVRKEDLMSQSGTSREEKAKASLAEYTEGAKYHAPGAGDLKIVALDYIILGDYADADTWLTKMLQWSPADSEGWYYLGRTKYNEGRFEEAVRAFSRSLDLDPRNVKAEDNLGLAYAGLGRIESAIAAFDQAIAWQQNAATKNSGPFIDMGSLLLDQNRTAEAVPYLQQALQIASLDPKAHELLGKAHARLEQFPEAQIELERAAELAPQNPNLPCMLGPVYRKRGLPEKAKMAFDRCAALNGTHSSPATPVP